MAYHTDERPPYSEIDRLTDEAARLRARMAVLADKQLDPRCRVFATEAWAQAQQRRREVEELLEQALRGETKR